MCAASCEQEDVQAAIDNACDGDIVFVPKGECVWTTTNTYQPAVIIPANKRIYLVGTGSNEDGTLIKHGGGTCLGLYSQGSTISEFRFLTPTDYDSATISVQNIGWRIYNNSFGHVTPGLETRGSTVAIQISSVNDELVGVNPQGLIDNNIFEDKRIVVGGGGNFNEMNLIWTQENVWGTADDVVYVENNNFLNRLSGNIVDTNYGGKYVFRYNTASGLGAQTQVHSLQGDQQRGSKSWEIYKNTFIYEPYIWTTMFIRGGTGFVWGNDITGITQGLAFDNVRSYRDVGGDVNQCNGESSWDENIESNGWPCRDQIGRGKDMSLWTEENPYPPQELEPAYVWLNRDDENILNVFVHNNCGEWIKSNRDYYNEIALFDGSSGVGSGTYSQMSAIIPSTTNVGFWCTDKGSNWDTINLDENDGCLYVWNGDSWEIKYIPYTYPHPLTLGGISSNS